MIRLAFLMVWFVSAAEAQAVRVTAGEHDDFTRVVLQFPAAVEWQVGRSDEGYELRVEGMTPRYDLSRAFDLIPRDRLASLWADPESGALRVGVACACHALPFALRPDTVVIDLRDGAPPPEWGFEVGFDGRRRPPLSENPAVVATRNHPEERAPVVLGDSVRPALDWFDTVSGAPAAPAALPMPDPQVDGGQLRALRETLTENFARAATQDLVDPVEKIAPSGEGEGEGEGGGGAPAMANVRLGAGLDVRPALEDAPDLASDGQICPEDETLAVQDWGDARPIHEQMADGTASLAGEFDRTQPDALYRAVRFQLFLGFGAEARGLMRAFDGPLPDAPLWEALSRLVDGEPDADGAFKGLAGCDGPAALWATVADPSLSLAGVNTQALLRAFSALPPHLRTGIGPPLAERFIAAGDRVTAQALSDALLRPSGTDDARRTALMEVRFRMDAGDLGGADAALAPLVADPGPLAADILATRIDLAALTGAPVDGATVTALEAMLSEAGGEDAIVLRRALVLGHAMSGAFDEAFRLLPESPATRADLWRVLAEKGPDEALLHHALTADAAERAEIAVDTRRRVAERLLTLGFPEATQAWAGADDPLLSARAALLLGQPAQVLQILGPADGDEARKLKAEALLQVDSEAAVPEFGALGDTEAEQRAARLANAWPELAAKGAGPWRKVAEALATPDAPDQTLARSRALADSAAETRAAIENLLESVPSPEAQ